MPTRPAELRDAFRLGEVLGRGGSATVYAARPASSRTRVAAAPGPIALKVLHAELAGTPGAADAFFAEARALQRISDPNVVRVLGYGTTGGAPWIAYERAEGRSLADLIDERGPLTPDETSAVADGILRGLTAVHAAGLVHRDLTPVNVFVAPDDIGDLTARGVRILDFGLADAPGRTALAADVLRAKRPVASDDELGVLGSVGYLSTEHALGLPVDERGDLYQVAALVHLMLTGRPPYQRSTAKELMAAHAGSPPPLPSVQDSTIPAHLDQLVLRGMQKRPDQRFASASDMRAALLLRTLQYAPPVAARTGGMTEQQASPGRAVDTVSTASRRSPVPLALIAAALAAGIVAVWLAGAGAAQPQAVLPPPPAAAASTTAPVAPGAASRVDAASRIIVPDLVGLPESAAQERLRAAGLRPGRITLSPSARPAAVVLGSMPAAGSLEPAADVVDLVVASGSNTVPDTRGQPAAAAQASVGAAGFVTQFRTVSGSGAAPGAVAGSEPAPGVAAPLGSTVTLLVEGDQATPSPVPGPPTAGPTTTPTPGPPRTATPTPTPTPSGHGATK